MSLRFLKAKPKLSLNKDKKVRSAQKSELKSNDNTSNESQEIPTHNLVKSNEIKTKLDVKPENEPLVGSVENPIFTHIKSENVSQEVSVQNLVESNDIKTDPDVNIENEPQHELAKSNEESRPTNIKSNINNNICSNDQPNEKAPQESNSQRIPDSKLGGPSNLLQSILSKEVGSEVPGLSKNKSEENSISNKNDVPNKTSSNSKFRFLKAKPKIELNVQLKNRTSQHHTQDKEATDAKPEDEIIENAGQRVISPNLASKRNVELDGENRSIDENVKSMQDLSKPSSGIKAANGSTGIQLENEPNANKINTISDKNILNTNQGKIDYQKTTNTKDLETKTKRSNDPKAVSLRAEINQDIKINPTTAIVTENNLINVNQNKNSHQKTTKDIPTVKSPSKSLSTYIKHLEKQKHLFCKPVKPLKCEKVPTIAKSIEANVNLEHLKSTYVEINDSEKKICDEKLKEIYRKNIIASTSEEKKDETDSTKNIKEDRKSIRIASSKSTVQKKGEKISNLISDSTDSTNLKKYKIPTSSKSKTISKSKPLSNIENTNILTEENIDSIPFVLDESYSTKSKPLTGRDLEERVVVYLLDDHIYAKPIAQPLKNKPSKPKGHLNAFQRALLEEEECSRGRVTRLSESSEPGDIRSVDVSVRAYEKDGEDRNEISYLFNDEELNPFSGLSLVAKIIKEVNSVTTTDDTTKEENRDPLFLGNMCNDLCHSQQEQQHGEIQETIEEEVIYLDNIVPVPKSKVRNRKRVSFNLESEEVGNKKQKSETRRNVNKENRLYLSLDDGTMFETDDNKACNTKPETKYDAQYDPEYKPENDEEYLKYDPENDENYSKYDPENEKEYSKYELEDEVSETAADKDEREVLISRPKHNPKKKISESVFLKRQSETMRKIKTMPTWKENLTVSDLMFYNPANNPMTNPPEISMVKSKEIILDDENKEIKTNVETEDEEEEIDNPEPVPQLKISADGKLIIDPKSLIIEETGLKKSKKRLAQSEAVVESQHTIKKFDSVYSKRKKLRRGAVEWTAEDTIMFYRAVNTIGTDFSLMATLFQNRTRVDLKKKFKYEERKNSNLLWKAMTNYNSFDIDELKQDMDADKKRIELMKAQEKERKAKVKEEAWKSKKAKTAQKPKRTRMSVYGKLLNDDGSVPNKKIVEYVSPHPNFLNLFPSNKTAGNSQVPVAV